MKAKYLKVTPYPIAGDIDKRLANYHPLGIS
jgi:hypothetical protein